MKIPTLITTCLAAGGLMVTHPGAQEATTTTETTTVTTATTTDSAAHTEFWASSPPSLTFYGNRGLSQTSSAEALGYGRLIFSLSGTWYQQDRTFFGVPPKDANIYTGIGALSFGLNRFVDLFGSLTGYGSTDWDTTDAAGVSVTSAGLHVTLPSPKNSPFWLGAEGSVNYGFSGNQIDYNRANGYDYHETRTDLDFTVKLLQTLALGEDKMGIRLHANEGIVTSIESGKDPLMLLGFGAQMNLFAMVLGFEAHSRTFFDDIDMTQDPLWLTPSLQIRIPYNFNLNFGGDISVASEDNDSLHSRSLEPYRLFAGLAFTFDTQADKKREAQAKMQEAAFAKAQVQLQADSLAKMQDSLAMKAQEDSLALAAAQKQLQEERAKRSDAENKLLTTGTLPLDTAYFRTGSAEISLNSKPYLKLVAEMLVKYPKLQIEVAGHTDSKGTAEYNQKLSQSRAESVAAYMISQQPALRGTVTAKGYGESQPVADNATEAGRKLNRRIELRVLNKVALEEYNP